MKSLIKVIVVFWIAQSVCCNTDENLNIKLEVNSKGGNEIVGAFYKIVQNCDKMEMKNLFEKIMRRSNANSVQDKFEEFQKKCFDKEENNKIIENYNELSTFLKNCIDPKYSQAVEKLNLSQQKFKNVHCKTNEQEFKELYNNLPYDLGCFEENVFQVMSCIFSEKEMRRLTKNVSQVVDFTMMLIEGNDNECGVINRIEKCFMKIMNNCEGFPKIIDYYINKNLESFDCKIDETTDLSKFFN